MRRTRLWIAPIGSPHLSGLYSVSSPVVVEKTTSAAAAAKAEADRRRSTASKSQTTGATPPRPKLESLTITVTPDDAEIALTNSLNKLIPMTSGVAKDLPAGRYELRVSKADYKPYTHTLTMHVCFTRLKRKCGATLTTYGYPAGGPLLRRPSHAGHRC